MKNITFSADEALIHEARRRAEAQNITLNELFREWLSRYVAQPAAPDLYDDLMARLQHVNTNRTYTREEMNERR